MLFREKVVSSAIYIPYLGPWYLTGGLLKLFLLAVQSSAFVLKINLGDNFTPGRAFSNLSVCCLGRVEAYYFFHPCAAQRAHLNPPLFDQISN